jgi:hypothetical protein
MLADFFFQLFGLFAERKWWFLSALAVIGVASLVVSLVG